MINLLFIAPEFPPVQAAGAFRALRFVKHLPSFGIRPIVVCFNPEQIQSNLHPINLHLQDKVPADTQIVYIDVSVIETEKVAWKKPLRPTPGLREVPHTYSPAELFDSISQRFSVDAIYATIPPFNVDRLILQAKAHFCKPLLLDMRDAWSLWGSAPFRTWLHYRMVLARERALLNAAKAVIGVTNQLVEMERKLVPDAGAEFCWIPNAHDAELPSGDIRLLGGKDRYRVGYVGQFYFNAHHETASGIIPWYRKLPHRWLHYHATSQRWIYRTPHYFFKAWAEMKRRYPETENLLEFHYVGDMPTWLPEMAQEFGVANACTWHGIKTKQDTLAFLEGCDVALATSIKVEGGEDYCLASKTFDYISQRKPVLGFVCEGAQKDFLAGAGIAKFFDPDNETRSATALRQFFTDGFESEIDPDYLSKYSPTVTSEQIADVVHRMTNTD